MLGYSALPWENSVDRNTLAKQWISIFGAYVLQNVHNKSKELEKYEKY